MPPFLPRKRLRSETPEASPASKLTPKGKGKTVSGASTPRKPTLFDDLDAGAGPRRTATQSKVALAKLAADDDDDSSSLSELSSEDDFEDVPITKRQKTAEASEDSDEDMEFEDVQAYVPKPEGPAPSGDLELTLKKDTRVALTNPFGTKKGPSKIERQIRTSTHQMHVQLLMWHNAIRNAWCCNKELQDILVNALPKAIMEKVDKWRRDSGLVPVTVKPSPNTKGKTKTTGGKKQDVQKARDWGEPAKRLAEGEVDMSGGDPLFRLLKYLSPYWKQRFRVIAPGLRKLGYMSLQRLDEETKSFYNDKHDPERHGERIADLEDFKECARKMEGSRDVGAQLFTALLRGLGIESRLVASLQPLGFGWSQIEEAGEKNPRKLKKPKQPGDNVSESDANDEKVDAPQTTKSKPPAKSKKPSRSKPRASKGAGAKETPIELGTSDDEESDDDSIIDVTPAKQRALPSKPYDKDMYPIYWTEVLSPVTHTYTPVDAMVLNIIATSSELLQKFEVRSAKAEQLKQVTAYIIGHSSDGTAKDVTTRYLRNRTWPSKTKGFRIGVEKIAIRNRHGKVKRYEEADWFKTVMSGYTRGTKKFPRTEEDDLEDTTVLKPNKPEKKVVEDGKETLQYYKSSREFVLERHLRREEAIVPGAKHVKMFTIKGKGETSTEEKVYLRKDVVSCKSMETWHKEGRAPIVGEAPLKHVPYRAATTNRKRELAEAEHATGEKMRQGLYSWDQTEWIIPPPIEDGIIPKNAFGNIDLYVDSMLPAGAAHVPYRGTVKICKRLEIDYAEAVTGFEFGHRMAVPVITGVVIAEEHYDAVMEEWEKDEAERVRKEDEKRQKAAIHMWRKMLMGLRVIDRIREEYGDADAEIDEINPWTRKVSDKGIEQARKQMEARDEDMAGGFFLEGHHEEEVEERTTTFFPVAHEEDDEDQMGGGFVIEGHEENSRSNGAFAYATPQSLQSNTKHGPFNLEEVEHDPEVKPPTKGKGRATGTNKKATITKPTSATKPTTTKKQTPRSKAPTRRKAPISDDNPEEDEDDPSSSLSSLDDSDFEAADDIPTATKPKKTPTRKAAATPKSTAASSTRKTPKRSAAKKSETALKSHYFAHSDDDGVD